MTASDNAVEYHAVKYHAARATVGPLAGTGNRRRSAFTMVEMLIVIAVIGALISLLVPAFGVVREYARRTKCMNYQKELASACAQYENSKQGYPGYVESIGQFPVSWVVPLLPYLGKTSTYRDWRTYFGGGALPGGVSIGMYVDQFKCPSDASSGGAFPLSYVANCGMRDALTSTNPPDWPANGVFFSHDPRLSSDRMVTMTSSNIKDGPQYTLMLSENIQAGWWTDPYRSGLPSRDLKKGVPDLGFALVNPPANTQAKWTPPDIEASVGMIWIASNSPGSGYKINDLARELVNYSTGRGSSDENYKYARPSSYHSGGVNAVFCDTHGKFIRESIEYRVYGQLLSSCDREIRNPGTSGRPNVSTDWNKPLTEEDF